MSKFSEYVKNSIIELKKVSWPTKKETYHYTLLVIIFSLATALFLGGLDFLFSSGLELLIKY